MKNYYDILGIPKTASADEVKSAFRKLAQKYHPDKKGGDEAKFKEVSEAYSTLSDPQKRKQYDMQGAHYNNGSGGPQGGFGGFDFSGFANNAQGFNFNGQNVEFDFGDIFGDVFGGGRSSPQQARGRDVALDVELTFQESMFGVERRILVAKVGTCKTCSGSGAAAGSKSATCKTCNGNGEIRETRNTFFGAVSSQRVCPTCHGRRTMPDKVCSVCRGEGVARQQEEIHVVIPAGVADGEMVRMPGKGEVAPHGTAGDLYIKLHVKPDKVFTREGHNLHMTISVRLTDAILGTSIPIKTFDGEESLSIPPGTNTGDILRIRGKGVPTGRSRGDILVRVTVDMPKKLSRKAREMIEALKIEGV